MKTIFAIIGFTVVAMWCIHHAGNKNIRSGVKAVWNITSPYINNAVNGVHNSAKQAIN